MRILPLGLLLCSLLGACFARSTLTPKAGFSLPLGRDQPLTGRIWSARRQAFATRDELLDAVRKARFLLIGETHDNADHHQLEASLLENWLEAHAHAGVGFEMIDEGQAPALREPLPTDPDAFAHKLAWDDSGWPEFALYRPVFEVALLRRVRVFAAHPSRERLRAAMHAVEAGDARALALDPPLPAAARDALAQEIRDSHCGHAPEAMVAPMIAAQSFKDAWMARALHDAHPPAALIAGRGHVRNDRAVPVYLKRRGAQGILSIALIDVDPGHDDPADYELAAYDFAIFTPRTSDASACDRFREQLERMHKGTAAAAP